MIPPLRGLLRPSAALNIVFDGNSLVYGTGSSVATMPQRVLAGAPIAGSGATVTNLGISGQTWRQMNGLDAGGSSDVDAAWVSDKYNVLVCWETINSITNAGRTVSQCYGDATGYIAARKVAHPWRVVLLTALPRGVPADVDLQAWNALAVANYRAMGADLLVDVRAPGSPFAFNGDNGAGGVNSAAFQAQQSLWYETSGWTHLTDAGYQVIANMVCAALRRLPAKAAT